MAHVRDLLVEVHVVGEDDELANPALARPDLRDEALGQRAHDEEDVAVEAGDGVVDDGDELSRLAGVGGLTLELMKEVEEGDEGEFTLAERLGYRHAVGSDQRVAA